MAGRPLLTESDVLAAADRGLATLHHPPGALVTALARDTARDRGIALVPRDPDGKAAASEPTRPSPEAPPTTLALGCDHAGFAYKEALAVHARALGFTIVDVGTGSTDSVDYPDFAYAVARLVALGRVRFGLMLDGVGVGSAMVANKVPGVRAALCPDVFSAFNARAHNDANVLTLGSRTMGIEACKRVLKEFLETPFEGGRHGRRVDKITDVEARFLPGAVAP